MLTSTLARTFATALLMTGAATSQAALLLVTTTADSFDGVCNLNCSLRDAVAAANQTASADVILLRAGTYVLSRLDSRDGNNTPIDEDGNLLGDLDVTGELLIHGAGIGKTFIKGPNSDLFAVEHRLLEARPGTRLALKHLTLTDGRSSGNGAAVENHGSLLLENVQALGNITREWTSDGGYGGAIANYGELRVLDSQFENNSAIKEVTMPLGGAIYNSGNLWVRGSHFFSNGLGGLPLDGAGAGIYSSGTARIESSSFIQNSAGELAEGGTITNDGGGLLTLTNSTLSGNWQGALSNGRNDATSQATLTNVTIVDNTVELSNRYAVMNWGQLRVRNSVIAGNHEYWGDEPVNCRNLGGSFSYQAIGLLRNDEQSNCGADLFVPDEQTFTLVLAQAPSSDGKTSFHPLLPGSPAVDAGIGGCIAQDQRGVTRPQDGNGDGVAVCDLGAYELTP
jgi:CSLREA domain-containing protein